MVQRRITDLQLASIGTTKIISVTSSEVLYQIGSGNRAFEFLNPGIVNIFYGQSNLQVNSGIYVSSNGGTKFWDSVSDTFSFYLRINSGGLTTQAIIQEYQGNE